MNTLADVFRVLQEIRRDGVVADYAVGGATAMLFYSEPTRTYDLDVFVATHEEVPSKVLLSLDAIYSWAKSRGYPADAEHILVHGVPVQFLPAYNPLVQEAVAEARDLVYEGVPVRVVGPEHLVALAFQAGGSRRRERAHQLLDSGEIDRARLRSVLERHGLAAEMPGDA